MTNKEPEQPESRAGPPGYDFRPFDVSVRTDGAAHLVIEVEGELDLATGPILRQHLKPYQAVPERQDSLHRIVYHLSDLRFMDATGLQALLTAVDGHGPHTITFREPSPQVRRLLELVGLDWMIDDRNEKAYR